MSIQYRTWSFLAACFVVLMFGTESAGVMVGSLFAAAGCIGRALYWKAQR